MTIRLLVLSLPVFLVSGLSACSNTTGAPQPASQLPTSPLEEKVKKLERDLIALRLEVHTHEIGSVDVSTEEKGYAIARTGFGTFLVSTANVAPYLDGFKVRLAVGNLNMARFEGGKVNVIWGAERQYEKKIDLPQVFAPGRYTPVDLLLTPAKPEDVKNLSLMLEFDRVRLLAGPAPVY